MIPFFVADRPMSLRLLKGLPLRKYSNVRIGIMAHANTTLNFQQALRQYPCDDLEHCDVIGSPCRHKENIPRCPIRRYVLSHTVKMCDSGIFTREGATLTYDQLFQAYVRMGIEYGVMIDVFRDPQATLESAKEALAAHKPYAGKFHLVGVAQGRTVEEYLGSYQSLKEMGFTHVAVGGLLRRVGTSVRYTQVRDEAFLYEVLSALRARYSDDWLFALGCFHPSRLAEFNTYGVWGDYKGWIFQYNKVDDELDGLLKTLENNDLQHLHPVERGSSVAVLARLEQAMSLRTKLMTQKQETHSKLVAGRTKVRENLTWLYHMLRTQHPETAALLKPILTHALLDDTEDRRIRLAVELLEKPHRSRGSELLSYIQDTRALKDRSNTLERRIRIVNGGIAERAEDAASALPPLASTCQDIIHLINTSERDHRFAQVRHDITSRILSPLKQMMAQQSSSPLT